MILTETVLHLSLNVNKTLGHEKGDGKTRRIQEDVVLTLEVTVLLPQRYDG
jgi:hypothetical protein